MKTAVQLFIFLGIFFSSYQVFGQIDTSEKQLISNLIDKKRTFNKEFGYGFRIQLYNGFEIEAKKIRAKFRIDFPETKTYLLYQQPEWKIQIGHFKTRLEADRFILELKKKYPYSIVVPLGK